MAAGDRPRALDLAEQGDRLVETRRPVVLELGWTTSCTSHPPPPPFASRIARRTRSGVNGMSRCRIPSGASASMTAFATAAVDAIVPVSPAPLTPAGWASVGVSVPFDLERGEEVGLRDGVVHHRARHELAAFVVGAVLPERLCDALGDAPVYLAVDDHRVDHLADVVDRDVALERHLAGLGVDVHDGDVRSNEVQFGGS